MENVTAVARTNGLAGIDNAIYRTKSVQIYSLFYVSPLRSHTDNNIAKSTEECNGGVSEHWN